jgi:Zn ribbon nucleic-acid-binding protein
MGSKDLSLKEGRSASGMSHNEDRTIELGMSQTWEEQVVELKKCTGCRQHDRPEEQPKKPGSITFVPKKETHQHPESGNRTAVYPLLLHLVFTRSITGSARLTP